MSELGKFLMIAGLALLIIGAITFGLGRAGFRGLPGDISFRSAGLQIHFPFISCIVLSLLLTLGVWLFHWLSGR